MPEPDEGGRLPLGTAWLLQLGLAALLWLMLGGVGLWIFGLLR
jgi:hypothetical protein